MEMGQQIVIRGTAAAPGMATVDLLNLCRNRRPAVSEQRVPQRNGESRQCVTGRPVAEL